MSSYVDASFLFSFYNPDSHTSRVEKYLKNNPLIVVADIAHYEFMQAVRLKMFLHSHQKNVGLTKEDGKAMLDQFNQDLNNDVFKHQACNWPEVFRLANELSARHTRENGYRSFDLLHVAAALHLQAAEFLTFDQQQGKLAKAEGLALVF